MTKKEQLANVVAALDERETELVLRYIYQLRNEDLINEDGEVIIDSFYKNLLEDIDQMKQLLHTQKKKYQP
ncbi:hypothetical protein V4S29_12635 [Enterococcus cecorum]|uniref:hypothetical protein n=1 Tax=Enterococcus cecorum TaxID=44008 RepID=UPI0032636A3C